MKKIYINPGHSNFDPGAVGFETERTLNVSTANFMKEYLCSNYEVEVKITDGNVRRVKDVAADSNKWAPDLFVSIHNNAGGGDGWEGLVCSENRVSLGKIFEKYVKKIGQNSRGVKIRPDLTVLNSTTAPAILCEGAFVDNEKDISDWNEPDELKKLATAYAKAAADFLSLPGKKKSENADYIYRVQVGAFSKKANAELLLSELKSKGFLGFIVKSKKE